MVGDLVIDTLRHTARRGAREIPLTATEFAFVVYMARNAGRVVSRAELLSHVWGDTRATFSNILDVYASRLRHKIDDGEAVALFSTVRGSGFLLEAPVTTKPAKSPSAARTKSPVATAPKKPSAPRAARAARAAQAKRGKRRPE